MAMTSYFASITARRIRANDCRIHQLAGDERLNAGTKGAVLYHDISNVSWLLFPNHGSHWDPRITGLILAFATAIVTILWGPRTLARYRMSRKSKLRYSKS